MPNWDKLKQYFGKDEDTPDMLPGEGRAATGWKQVLDDKPAEDDRIEQSFDAMDVIPPEMAVSAAAKIASLAKMAPAAGLMMGKMGIQKAAQTGEKLAMDEASRLARAKEIGFDTSKTYYHGMPNKMEGNAFDPKRSKTKGLMFFSDDPSFAGHFADGELPHAPGQNVLPVHLKTKDAFDYENPDHIESLSNLLGKRNIPFNREEISNGGWEFLENPNIIKAIKDLGHDGMHVREWKNKNLAVFEPHQIRSKFAEFDPSKADSGNISAGLAGAGLLGASQLNNEDSDKFQSLKQKFKK
jgi:hypothetical protein